MSVHDPLARASRPADTVLAVLGQHADLLVLDARLGDRPLVRRDADAVAALLRSLRGPAAG